MKHKSDHEKPMHGDDVAKEAIDRGTSGQSLLDKELHYDPATGKPNHGTEKHTGRDMDD